MKSLNENSNIFNNNHNLFKGFIDTPLNKKLIVRDGEG